MRTRFVESMADRRKSKLKDADALKMAKPYPAISEYSITMALEYSNCAVFRCLTWETFSITLLLPFCAIQ